MILEGNERGYGAELARHLLNAIDNDHVEVHSIDGFVASDLSGAFEEAEAISQGTQCQKYLFSLSLNPPPGETVPDALFETAVAKVEKKLGLSGQPRALVFHEKKGRRHAHCVWSRIDAREMKAIRMSLYKTKLKEVSRELYLEQDWRLPDGFRNTSDRDPNSYRRQEAQQAKRADRDPKALRRMFRACWEQSDGRAGFAAALEEQGYLLARGDRRGFVAIDRTGKIWSLSRWCGVKPKDLRQKLGPEEDLPRASDLTERLKALPPPKRVSADPVFEEKRQKLVARQRAERRELQRQQEARMAQESIERNTRLPRGLKAVLARVTGKYQSIEAGISKQAQVADARDTAEKEALVSRHLEERREVRREARRLGVSAAFGATVRLDPRQPLVLQDTGLPYTAAQLLRDPGLVLEHLSATRAQFGLKDIRRQLSTRITDAEILSGATEAALASPELVPTEDGVQFTTKGYLAAQEKLEKHAADMLATRGFAVGSACRMSAVRAQNVQMQKDFGASLSDEQNEALDHIFSEAQLSMVVGFAGAGKSTLLATAAQAWAKSGVTVHGAALSGKAADGLESTSGIPCRTLASLETAWENGYDPVSKGDVMVIDEAGMIGTRQLARISEKMREIGAKLVLVGDPEQLQPIEAGTPFKDLVQHQGATRLTEVHRQREDWQKQASKDLAAGRVATALDRYETNGDVTLESSLEEALEALVERYLLDAETAPGETRLALAHRRVDVHKLNQAIRAALREENQAPEVLVQTETGPRAFAAGDRIVLTRNDKALDVKNGMLGSVESVTNTDITVMLDGDRTITIDTRAYRYFDHGYAVTVHKSQGATVDMAYVLGSRSMDKHLAYVALTRHRQKLHVALNADDFPSWAGTRRSHDRTNAPSKTPEPSR
ncbi:AAA family ATPase [Roseobacter sp. S98]|uniref:AAA family ATPase n=1 Tax=Roseobacter algicola (ex Choi et al. 2025) (nom. illeg.) TaxID=3092138 RepID=UPI003F517107